MRGRYAWAGLALIALCSVAWLASGSLNVRLFEAKHGVNITAATPFHRLGARTSILSRQARFGEAQLLVLNGYVSMWLGHGYTNTDDDTIMGLVPGLYSHGSKTALVVGAGTGVTPAAVASMYDSVWTVDLDPNTPDVLHHFRQLNSHLQQDATVHRIVQDAASWLLNTSQRFDMILVQTTSPATRGANAVFTREFMALARKRLQPGGAFALWMGVADHVEGMQIIQRTVGAVFDQQRWYVLQPGYVLVMASMQPVAMRSPSKDMTLSRQQSGAIARHLANRARKRPGIGMARDGSPIAMLRQAVTQEAFVPKMPADARAPVNSMNSPRLQFVASATWLSGLGLNESEFHVVQQWLRRQREVDF